MGQINKILARPAITAATLTDYYTPPVGVVFTVITSVLVANISATTKSFRIAVSLSGVGFTDENYTHYDIEVARNTSLRFDFGNADNGIFLKEGDTLKVYRSTNDLKFTFNAVENYF